MDDCRKSARICVETLKFYGTQIVILHDHQFRENELFTHLFWKEFNQLLCIKQCHYVSHVKSVDPQSSWETDSVTLSGIACFHRNKWTFMLFILANTRKLKLQKSCKHTTVVTNVRSWLHNVRKWHFLHKGRIFLTTKVKKCLPISHEYTKRSF